MEDGDLVLGSGEIIQTSGGNFDPTILTKYIGAEGFNPCRVRGTTRTRSPSTGLLATHACDRVRHRRGP